MKGLFEQFSKEFKNLLGEFHLPFENPILTFSVLLLIILLAPILLRKIKIPGLIGLILSGVLIGPNGFQLISEENMTTGFVNMFSKIGLLYIMFMAGLELDMQEFKRYRNKSITFGALTFFIPLLLGYPICRYVLDLGETASLLTASMFATHTLVAYPIVSKFGISKMEAVAIAIGGTILTDTAVLIILAVISGSDNGTVNASILIHLFFTLSIFSFIMFWGVPKASRWIFRKLESEKASQFIYVLSVLFFAAFLAEVAGIEGIIGAFVAGLVMNRLIPHSSILMNRVEFMGNSLFIPFFLISIGMMVNVKALANEPWAWVVAGILSAFAIISKFLAAWVTQIVFGLKGAERQVIFGLTTAHAAATLAVINVGYTLGIINIDIVNGTVVLILITSMTASFVTEHAGKRLLKLMSSKDTIEKPSLRSQHVLVAANELNGNEQLLDFSILISDKNVINPVSIVSVLDNDKDAEVRIRSSRRHMDDFILHYTSGEVNVHAMATIDSNFSSGIARVSKELVADIVLINDDSSSNTNLLNQLVGGERENLLHACHKTIFFCKFKNAFSTYRTIVLVCPPFAELEPNCNQWIERVMRIARELSCGIQFYGSQETFLKLQEYQEVNKFANELNHVESISMEDFLPKLAHFGNGNLLITVFARSGSVSSFVGLESIPQRMSDHNQKMDQIFIYPGANDEHSSFSAYEDMSKSPINAGVETIQRITKEVVEIFKKPEE